MAALDLIAEYTRSAENGEARQVGPLLKHIAELGAEVERLKAENADMIAQAGVWGRRDAQMKAQLAAAREILAEIDCLQALADERLQLMREYVAAIWMHGVSGESAGAFSAIREHVAKYKEER